MQYLTLNTQYSMLMTIAGNECRYMLWSLQSLVTFGVFLSIGFLLTANAGEFQSFAPGGQVLANSPYNISDTLLKFSVATFFVVPAYMANTVLKDTDSKFDAILFTLPVGKTDYLIGRFLGAFVALAIAFSGGALGLFLGTLWPWADSTLLGPTQLSHYAITYVFFIVPSLFAVSGILFAVAVYSRSFMFTQVIAIGLFIIYLVVDGSDIAAPIFDPFMIDVFRDQTRYWTATERNAMLMPFNDMFIENRALWLGLSISFIALAWWRFSFSVSTKKPEKQSPAINFSNNEPAQLHVTSLPRGVLKQSLYSFL